jgi:ribosomal protein S12 methylthiotransferase accessory factor
LQEEFKVAKAKLATRAHLAPGVRVWTTHSGLILLSSKGCFRLSGPSAEFFVSEALPALNQAGTAASSNAWTEETSAFAQSLVKAGILDDLSSSSHSESKIPVPSSALEMGVACVRRTPLADAVVDLLRQQGILIMGEPKENALVFADLCALDSVNARQLAHDLHKKGCRSISFWKHGPESFYGPFVHPGRTACWRCFEQRFSDSLTNADAQSDSDLQSSAKVVADNLLLALHYPDATPYSSVLVERGDFFSAHAVLPVPSCEVCNFTDPSNLFPVVLAHSPHVPEDLRPLADPRGGIVRQLLLFESDGAEAPRVPCCCSVRIAPVPNGNGPHPEIRGEGKGATTKDAVRGAIGEGVERYSASIWRASELILSSYNRLHTNAFDPRSLVLYNDTQYASSTFPYAPFDPDRPLYWKAGKWLDTGESAYLPAISTYMNFPVAPADCFTQTTSNGLAAGSTVEDATLRALYELIERDAFMLFWLARLPALPIDIDDRDELVHRALVEVAGLGARIELYLIDVGTGHPTIVCLGLGDGKSWPGVTVGLGTHADIDIALRKAVFEHNHYGSYIRNLMLSHSQNEIRNEDEVKVALDHGLYYLNPAHANALDSFRAKINQPTPLAQLRTRYQQQASLPACVSCLAEAGIRTAVVDLTPPDVKLAPLRVVRVFGTWMQPIHFGAANWRLNNPRLQRLLINLINGANTTPHPIA